jgi:ribosome biogenesis GTPase
VYTVELGDTVVEAAIRGRLKQEARTGDRVVAGDRVTVAIQRDGSATVEEVAPRESELVRKAPGRGRGGRVIAANVDQVLVVFAAARPEPRLRMLDRFLVLCEANQLAATVVLNKLDLAEEAAVRALMAPYEEAGYRVLLTSAVRGTGLDRFREALTGRVSVLTGPSGVGKSTLLNAIEPGLSLATAEVSEAVNKGRHTTVNAVLLPLDCGGYVADTPGLRELGLWGVSPEDLRTSFPEFLPLADACRFTGSCTHSHEPECAVREAADEERVNPDRYASYLAMLSGEVDQPGG